jgi:hypothetical protein
MNERPFGSIRELVVPSKPGDRARSLYRACILRAQRVRNPDVTRAERWPNDPVVDMVLRAAEEPTTLLGTPELHEVLAEFAEALTETSAGMSLFGISTNLSFGRAAQIALPFMTDLPQADFVAEGAPIPVVQGRSGLASLTPTKIATIVPLSNEMMLFTAAEAVVRAALMNNIGPSLDRRLFDDLPAVPGLRPAGLLNGVTASPASADANKNEALAEDVETLVGALAPYGGNGRIALITDATHAVRMVMRGFVGDKLYPMFISASPTVDGKLIAVAASALAVAIDPARIEAGGQVLLHMDDAPLPIIDGAGAMAAPVRSTWQTDSVGLRFTLPVSWALRAPGVAWLEPDTW